MKKTILTISIMILSLISYPQSSVTLTQEDLNKLPQEQKDAILKVKNASELTQNLETYAKYAGLGKEVGIGVNEALKAVSSTAIDLSEKPLGKWIIVLITWKIMGNDMVQLIFAPIWLIIVLTVSFYLYKNNTKRTVLISSKYNSEGKGWDKQYEMISSNDDYKTSAIVIAVVGSIGSVLILFM